MPRPRGVLAPLHPPGFRVAGTLAALALWLSAGSLADADPGELPDAPVAVASEGRARRPSSAEVARRIDALLTESLQARDAVPAGPADDGAFLRRAWLDLAGTVPTADDVRAFLADSAPAKRAALVARLLDSPDAERHFAGWFGRLLLGRSNVDPRRRAALEEFLAAAWRDELPYDRLVAALVSARGAIDEHGEAAYVAQFAQDTAELAGRTARLFLGVRIACAQCHDHPFDAWTRRDFAGLAGFFKRTRVEKVAAPGDETSALYLRAERQVKQLETALARARADLATADAAQRAALDALEAAEQARSEHASRMQPLAEAEAKALGRHGEARDLSARLASAASAAEASAARSDLPEPLKATAKEQARLARDLVAPAEIALREAAATLAVHERRRREAETAGVAVTQAHAQAADALRAATARREGLTAYVDATPALLAQATALRDQSRRLAALVPELVRARHEAAGVRVPPDRFRVFDQPGRVAARRPDPARAAEGDGRPRVLDGDAVEEGLAYAHLRETLAEWIASPGNPTFARTAVNRFAQQLWGRAFVEPVDEVGDGSRAFSPEALQTLADDFAASGFSLRRLIAVLTLALPYQQASRGGRGAEDTPFVRAPVRELQPEVLFRALTRALLPGFAGDQQAGLGGPDDALRGVARLFDDGEDRPATVARSGMRAALWLQNGGALAALVNGRKDGLAARVVADAPDNVAAVDAVYLAFLARRPTDAERLRVLAALPALPGAGAARAAVDPLRLRVFDDLAWSLANSSEFLTNH